MPPTNRPPRKKRPKSAPPPTPTTSDDFLAAGVAHEESAEKHRAGDASKAARFYARALAAYAAGLAAHPASFDLAYNWARARFALAQWPAVAAAAAASGDVEATARARLDSALDGHRRALGLRPGNADVLFNTAQVCVALAEVREEDEGGGGAGAGMEALEEAVRLLQRCFEVQEGAFARRVEMEREAQAQIDADARGQLVLAEEDESQMPSEEGDEHEHDSGVDTGEWAFIEEPVTVETVLDTVVALADALSSACQSASSLGVTEKMAQIEQSASLYVQQKAEPYITQADQTQRTEACTSRARMKASFLEAAYGSSRIDLLAYDQGLAAAFDAEHDYVGDDQPDFLFAYADCLQDFASAAAERGALPSKRWSRLDKALQLLVAAAKQTKDPAEVSKLHTVRGDTELMRLLVTSDASAPENLQTDAVRNTLVQNAQKFYRAARAAAQGDLSSAAQQGASIALIREAIASALESSNPKPLKDLQSLGVPRQDIQIMLNDMMENSVLSSELVHSIGL